ncbi:MAG: hypothetical protein ACE5FG_06615 [Myxococcota bacterium]
MRTLLPLVLTLAACVSSADPERYRLAERTGDWVIAGEDPMLPGLRTRYPEFFVALLDSERRQDLDLRPLREDLEHEPVDRRNYDALNAIAFAYFEMNARAEARRGEIAYLGHSFQTAKLAAVPWSAYGRVRDEALRNAILDFFEDIASGGKLDSGRTASRLSRTVSSLEKKESDATRRARIRRIAEALEAQSATP